MRAIQIYTMLMIAVIKMVEGGGNPPSAPELKPVKGTSAIGAVKLQSTQLTTSVSKSELLESEESIQRVAIANPDMIEVVAISERELVINAKAAGNTSLAIWTADGKRLFTVVVLAGRVAAR